MKFREVYLSKLSWFIGKYNEEWLKSKPGIRLEAEDG